MISRGLNPTSDGVYKFRVTNAVRFQKAGIYPIEVTYAQYSTSAALEMAVLFGSSFVDLDENAELPGTKPLGTWNFRSITRSRRSFSRRRVGAAV